MRDLYKVLGVTSGADDERIKSAFRERAKALHPDLNSGEELAERSFKELNLAYETLSDPKTRTAYDRGLTDERIRAQQNMGSVALAMFVVSMFSTASIFGTLVWLLTLTERLSLTDRTPLPPPEVTSPTVPSDQKIAAPLRALQPPPSPPVPLTPCSVHLAEGEPGLLSMALVDQHRAGTSTVVRVDDLDFRATFMPDGRLSLVVPRLSDFPVFQWALADGSPCRQNANAALSPQLSIALAWAGFAGLELHVIEPNSWLGSPAGHISSSRSNLDGVHGVGRFRAFGQPGDSTRVQLFVADTNRLGDRGFLNAVVTLESAGTGSCADAGQPSEIRYQVYIHHGNRGSDPRHPEVRSMAFQLPRCGEPESDRRLAENVLVKF